MNGLSELGLYLMFIAGVVGVFAPMAWIAHWLSAVIRERRGLYLDQELLLFIAIFAALIATLGFVLWVIG